MTIPVEQLGEPLSKLLESQDKHEAVELTKDAETVAWVVRLPKGWKDDPEADIVFSIAGPSGQKIVVLLQPKVASTKEAHASPVFGAGRGTLTIVSEDDEQLKDFQEYMR